MQLRGSSHNVDVLTSKYSLFARAEERVSEEPLKQSQNFTIDHTNKDGSLLRRFPVMRVGFDSLLS
jgi:hypothetical protein